MDAPAASRTDIAAPEPLFRRISYASGVFFALAMHLRALANLPLRRLDPALGPTAAAPPVPKDASPPPCALPPRRLPSIRPRRLRPPARSKTPACEAPDAPATPPSAPHRSTPRPPSVASRQINQTEPTLHRFESHPDNPASRFGADRRWASPRLRKFRRSSRLRPRTGPANRFPILRSPLRLSRLGSVTGRGSLCYFISSAALI